MMGGLKTVQTERLNIAYAEAGPAGGPTAILMHGFPYDIHSYAAVVPLLADRGIRCLVPFMRGYGETQFLSPDTMRSGEQAAFGADLRDFMDALGIERALLGGYDWGGRGACVVSALWPDRVIGLVTGGGYNIHDIVASARPEPPDAEHRYWYQYYFHSDRGRAGLTANRTEMAELLWRLWSPEWSFDADLFQKSARAFENPDFVDVVIHSYRVRYGYVANDPHYAVMEAALAKQPLITVPAINLEGGADGVRPTRATDGAAKHFTGPYQRRVLPRVGHNPPMEAPEAFAAAVAELAGVA